MQYMLVKLRLTEMYQYNSNILSTYKQTMKTVKHSKEYCEKYIARQCQMMAKRQKTVGKQMNKKNKYAYQLVIE